MKTFIVVALFIASATMLSFTEASYHQSVLINLNHSFRVQAKPNEFKSFKLKKSQLLPNKQYNIKLSWLGSVGVQMKIYWRNDLEDEQTKLLFKPLDTEKLYFTTDQNGDIEGASVQSRIGDTDEFEFTVVGYRNTRARDLETKNKPFEYIMKLEEVVVDGAPKYVLEQFGLVVGITIILVLFISKSYLTKNGFFNQIFTNTQEKKQQ